MYHYPCKIIKVVDGDTVDVDIDLGFGVWMKNQRIRMYGIDAPESRTSNQTEKQYGVASKRFLEGVKINDFLAEISNSSSVFGFLPILFFLETKIKLPKFFNLKSLSFILSINNWIKSLISFFE